MVRSILVFTVACIIGLTIQATMIHSLSPAAVAPDFILILVVYIGLHHHSVLGVIGAFSLGLLGDFASGQFLGPTAGGAVVAYGIVAVVSTKVYAEHPFAEGVLTCICSLAKSAFFVLIVKIYADVNVLAGGGLSRMLFEAGLTSLIAPIVIKVLRWGASDSGVQQHRPDSAHHRLYK